MRTTRLLVTAALTAGLAVAGATANADSAGATADPVSVVSISGGFDATTGGYVYDAAQGASVSFSGSTPDAAMTVSAAPSNGDPARDLTINIGAPSGQALAAGTYSTDETPSDPSHARLEILLQGSGCNAATGSLTVDEVTVDGATNDVTALAADYTYSCPSLPTISGVVRWNSALPFAAVGASPGNWDFGNERIDVNGISRVFTFRNAGTDVTSFGAATVSTDFTITQDACSGQSIAAGNTCTITVAPHPTSLVGVTSGQLRLPDADGSIADQVVPLQETGQQYPTTYVDAGPNRVQVNVGFQPGPIGAGLVNYSVYRSTSPTTPTFLRYIDYPDSSTIDYGVTPGTTYYYWVRANYQYGGGVLSTSMAALPWPRYSAGMYHRIYTSVRVLSGHTVVAGHPYAFKILGVGGVPSSGVSAVAIDVLVRQPTSSTNVTVYPYGTARPYASDLTVARGATKTEFMIATVGSGGSIWLSTSSGATPISIDVSGYYSASTLSTSYGYGGALHTYTRPGVILDTAADHIGAVPYGYYVDCPVNFTQAAGPHVSSLLVNITAYGAAGSGYLTARATNGRSPSTTVLAYAAHTGTANTAIVTAGHFYDSNSGNTYPSIAIENIGHYAVQISVTILGFYDDNSFYYGERYTARAPVHVLSSTMYSGSVRVFDPGTQGGTRTTALNLTVQAATPSASTYLKGWARGIAGVSAPSHGLLYAPAHVTTTNETVQAVGLNDTGYLINGAGTTRVNAWSFGRFDYYPVPSSPDYTGNSVVAGRQTSGDPRGVTASTTLPQRIAPQGVPGAAVSARTERR